MLVNIEKENWGDLVAAVVTWLQKCQPFEI